MRNAYSGVGDAVLPVVKSEPGPAIVLLQADGAGQRFAVAAQGQPLVDTTGPYEGVRPLDFDGGETTSLRVIAAGAWRIELRSPLSAPHVADAVDGIGDAVLLYTGHLGTLSIDANASAVAFAVETYGEGKDVLVRTTNPYSGHVPIKGGPRYVVVAATGSWSLLVS